MTYWMEVSLILVAVSKITPNNSFSPRGVLFQQQCQQNSLKKQLYFPFGARSVAAPFSLHHRRDQKYDPNVHRIVPEISPLTYT